MIKSGYDFSSMSFWLGRLRTLLLEELFFVSLGNFFRFLGKDLVKVNPMTETEDPMTSTD